MLAVYLGLRRGDLLGPRWEDIDIADGRLEVTRTLRRVDGRLQLSPPKTCHSRRTVSLPAPSVTALKRHRARRDYERLAAGPKWRDRGLVSTSLVGAPIEPDNLRRSQEGVGETIGDPSLRLQHLRHTCVRLLLESGTPPLIVRECVGHSAVDVTMTIYAHASLDEKRTARKRLGDRLA